jgi:hypothetical protein
MSGSDEGGLSDVSEFEYVSAALVLALTILGGAALVMSLIRRRVPRLARRPVPATSGVDLSPADGVVEIADVGHVATRLNEVDRRFHEFVRMDRRVDDSPGSHSVRARIATGPLRGTLALASIFLGRDGLGWSDLEISQAHRFLFKAGEWLEREAIEWSVPLNVALCRMYLAPIDSEPRAEVALEISNEEYRSSLFAPEETARVFAGCSAWAQKSGFPDMASLLLELTREIEADLVFWLIHSRSEGRSELHSESETGVKGLSLAVCYAGEADAPGPLRGRPFLDPLTVVHELLHAFGARDKYGTTLSRFPKREVSNRDVMRLDRDQLSKVRIDPMTAREIGWYAGGPLPEAIKRRTRRPPGWADGGSSV